MYVYILISVCMGVSMLFAGRNDYSDGNIRDGRFLVGLGFLFLTASVVLAILPS